MARVQTTPAAPLLGGAPLLPRLGSHPMLGYWLLGTAGAVFGMVSLGGVTRLTRSGLSIVEWNAHGEPLPLSDEEWEVAFDKYKAYPEFQRVNSRMTMEEFKPIYLMEWAHRMWGRGLGVVFGVPLVALAVARRIPATLGPRLGLLLGMGATQGAIGWWMVKSGLKHENFNEYQVPRVSPYRLATHLTGAWAIYSVLVWTGMDVLRAGFKAPPITSPAHSAALSTALTSLRAPTLLATTLLAITTVSGAFVAGNDAGHAYNDWPLFAGRWVPEELWNAALGARNFFENTATVQFDHRMLAYTTVAAVGGVHASLARAGRGVEGGGAALKAAFPAMYRGAWLLGGAVLGQATLGVATLMLYVPIELAALHQAGALATWTAALYYAHSVQLAVRAGRPTLRVV